MSIAGKPHISRDLQQAVTLLRSGRLVAFPTETVYGLGADATNSLAVAGIFECKQRPAFDPLIVHVDSISSVEEIVREFSPVARALAEAFWPGPLTLVLPRKDVIPDLVTAGLPGVGVRIPAHPMALELLQMVDRPIAAPSANLFGKVSPTTADHVLQGLGDRVDAILDGGPCEVGVESTVISCMEVQPVLLRPGGCPQEEIEEIVGPVRIAKPDPAAANAAQPAPGMLSRHYAPATLLLLVEHQETAVPVAGLRCGLLTEGTRSWSARFERTEVLAESADLKNCATGFFAALRSLDACGLDVIIAHEFPHHGLGVALNDRLRRAAAGTRSHAGFSG